MKFINRGKELQRLDELWDEKGSDLVVIYGKRRVGKTELIKHFLKGKPGVYFLADKRPEAEQLKGIGRRVGEYFKDEIMKDFSSWDEMFIYLKSRVKEPFVLALDEFPYLAEHNKALSSIFQKGWDEYLKDLPIYLILCGSSIAMMEEEVLGSKAPLYGRRSGQILLKPLSFYQAWNFFPKRSFEEFLKIFTITGGTPSYLLEIGKGSLEKNIEEILDRNSFLFREVDFVLREEFREPRRYLSILRAIAYNKTKFGEIVNETGLETSNLYSYLDRLRDLELIEKHIPATVAKPERFKRSTYHLQDNFFKFWFTYIHPYRSELEMGNKEESLRKLREEFKMMVAQTYESIAQDIIRKNQNLFFNFERIGRWWDGKNEIDLIALNKGQNKLLLGEVKWSRNKVGVGLYEDLIKKREKIKWGDDNTEVFYTLFSKSGFTKEMKVRAKEDKVVLFKGDEIVN